MAVRFAAIVISFIVFRSAAIATGPRGQEAQELTQADLKAVIPEGYKIEKMLRLGTVRDGREYLVGLTDVDETPIPQRPAILLLVATRDRVIVEDSVTLHAPLAADRHSSAPNYLDGLTSERLSGGTLALIRSVESGGGSGATHYFDFFLPERGKLHLVKSFTHGRMQRLYFAVYKGAIYDADVQCKRGEKRGAAYVYTCYLAVTKYAFDERAIVPAGSERFRERQGNRYLSDDYRNMSILQALRSGEIFRPSRD